MSDLPKTRKAIQLMKQGPPAEVLVLNENLPMPTITKPTQILIQVKAAGIEVADALLASGALKLPSFVVSFPTVLGMEFAGVVVETGDKVDEYAAGDEVYGVVEAKLGLNGTSTNYIVIDILIDAIAKKPKHLSFEQASTTITALAVYKGFVCACGYDINDKSTGKKILIIGASGGMGGYAVQMSKLFGAETVGICSGRNGDYVKQLGADRVIDYTDPSQIDALVANEPGSYDMVYDTIGGDDYYLKLKGLLKSKVGIYCTAVGPLSVLRSDSINIFQLAGAICKAFYRSHFASEKYVFYFGTLPNDQFHVIANWLETKQIVSTLRDESSVFDLENAKDLYDLLLNKKPVGRYTLRIN